ncbi:protein-glutamine gamma-glutamyltransferase E-like [Ascaphus truei]|uniref:protein-glutamine gamma-glutamyltransferase E-like n=1 Tax=Ascaphus truei TaxID=8439 RepID=UPI003F5A1608
MADPQVTSYDWHLAYNKTAHHTDAFDSSNLILRRGQPFIISLTLNRALQAGENVIFNCETGPSPTEASKTKTIFPLFGAQGKDTWSAALLSSSSNTLTLTMSSPPTAVIGQYTLGVAVSTSGSDKAYLQQLGGLYLLFNPWVPEDDVFLADEDQRKEYILNEYGVQFVGSEYEILGRSWEYNQFEKNVLEICLCLLDRNINYLKDPALDVSKRNDPLYVCRVLNAMVNSKDDNGVLVDNWSGDYADGVSPTSWNSSVTILKEWYNRGCQPVKYGQCWVYGGVLCTVLRCLGIPTRVITNFNSAQDRNGNLFIDLYYNSNGSSDETQQDLMWNFHVWNEAWFIRKDLGSSFNGWQVMDATPLETSVGIYRCGPAPLTAIKEGDVDLNYDVRFMFAAVNADLAYWVYYSDGTKKRTSNDTKSIGKFISTKAVGSDERVDVTHTYKYPEGSREEREVFEKAINKLYEYPMVELEKHLLDFNRRVEEKPKQGQLLLGRFTLAHINTVGQDIHLILSLKNLMPKSISVMVNMTSATILYTGRRRHVIWMDAKSAPLGPGEEKHISIPITYAQYKRHLTGDNMIRVTALCEVEGSEERILVERDITLEKPPITITLPSPVVINTAINAVIVVSNPFTETLNSCSLLVEGNGLIDGLLQRDLPTLKPGEKCTAIFVVTPFKTGSRQLLVTFTCDEIRNVKGSRRILVVGA